MKGYQKGSTGAFRAFLGPNVHGPYVDGVSITRESPRQHIWTFSVGFQENFNHYYSTQCHCILSSTQSPPSFVGSDYGIFVSLDVLLVEISRTSMQLTPVGWRRVWCCWNRVLCSSWSALVPQSPWYSHHWLHWDDVVHWWTHYEGEGPDLLLWDLCPMNGFMHIYCWTLLFGVTCNLSERFFTGRSVYVKWWRITVVIGYHTHLLSVVLSILWWV